MVMSIRKWWTFYSYASGKAPTRDLQLENYWIIHGSWAMLHTAPIFININNNPIDSVYRVITANQYHHHSLEAFNTTRFMKLTLLMLNRSLQAAHPLCTVAVFWSTNCMSDKKRDFLLLLHRNKSIVLWRDHSPKLLFAAKHVNYPSSAMHWSVKVCFYFNTDPSSDQPFYI